MRSDLEARIARLEQIIPGLRRRVKNTRDQSGLVLQALASGGVRTSEDGQPLGPYFDSTCGVWLPFTYNLTCPLFTGSCALNWDNSVGKWIGATYATQNVSRTSNCSTVTNPTSALVFQLTPGVSYGLLVQWKRCTSGLTGMLMQSTIPGTLIGTNLFGGGGQTGTDAIGGSLNCGTRGLTLLMSVPLSTGGSYTILP